MFPSFPIASGGWEAGKHSVEGGLIYDIDRGAITFNNTGSRRLTTYATYDCSTLRPFGRLCDLRINFTTVWSAGKQARASECDVRQFTHPAAAIRAGTLKSVIVCERGTVQHTSSKSVLYNFP